MTIIYISVLKIIEKRHCPQKSDKRKAMIYILINRFIHTIHNFLLTIG